jgi:N-acetylglutamate synthase-like GNAT family acetyltransferase
MIRKATKNDVTIIYQAHVSSIKELCSSMYTPSQIHAWTVGLSPDRYVQGIERFEFYVSEDAKGQISGLLIFNKELGEVYALYVAPWAIQKGLGRCFMNLAESMIRNQGHIKVNLKSTLNAVSFYERMGFECVGESIHELQNGETLPCVQMTKRLFNSLPTTTCRPTWHSSTTDAGDGK